MNTQDFIQNINWQHLPVEVVKRVKYSLLDTVGVAIAAQNNKAAQITRQLAINQFGANFDHQVSLLVYGDKASVIGASMAGAMLVDSLDSHDGHNLTKGHIGASAIPAMFAFAQLQPNTSPKDFIISILIAYEVGIRNAILLHSFASDYHSSGSWAGVGVAAGAAYLKKMNTKQVSQALGIAQYSSPIGFMMQCISQPTMVKDSAVFGALAGASSVLLAEQDFTAPLALNYTDDSLDDFCDKYYILETYYKLWPVCRWAQPSIAAIKKILSTHTIDYTSIEQVEIVTFSKAISLGNDRVTTTEQAQYSLGFPVAVMLIYGDITVSHITKKLSNEKISKMQEKIVFKVSDEYNNKFPAKRFASVTITLKNGKKVFQNDIQAEGDWDNPLNEQQFIDKFNDNVGDYYSKEQISYLAEIILQLEQQTDLQELFSLVLNLKKP